MRQVYRIVPSLLTLASLTAEDAVIQPAIAEQIVVTGAASEAYSIGNDGSAGKLDLPVQQDPLSRTALPRELLDARGAYSLREALRSAPGVTMAAGEGGRTGDSLNIRGFAANSDLYLDGLKDNGQYFRDTFATERVEVLRGASAVLFGRGATGGAVNTVTRKPTDHWTGDAAVTMGEEGFLRATAGIGGPLVDNVLGGRLDALYQTGGTFRDESRLDRIGIAPSLALKMGADTTLLAQVVHTREESNMDYGVPMYAGRPADVPVETYYGFKDDSFQEFDATLATATIEHRFSEHVSVRNATRHGDYYRYYRTEIPNAVNYNTDQLTLTQALRDNTQENLINQTELTANGSLLDREAQLVLGFEIGREEYSFRSKNSSNVPLIDIFDPQQPGTVGSGRADDLDGTLNAHNTAKARSIATYALLAVDLVPELKVVLGGRFDRYLADYETGVTTVEHFSRDDSMFSPRAGLVWTPVEMISVYASYSTSFNPSAETFNLSEATALLEPEETRNMEVGIKAELLERSLNLALAVFRLEKTNARTTDPNNSTLQVLDGEQRTDGIEAEITGHLGQRWTVQGGIALFDAEVVKSHNTATTWDGQTVDVEGLKPVNAAGSSGSLWVTYDFGGGLTTATGFYATSSRYADQANSVVLPGYVRFDANLAYVTRWSDTDWRAQLNVLNLFDTVHYEAGSTRYAYPGAPLAAQLTLAASF
jgi:catecholate siderophore receptor